jgi:hypothetical protein
MASNQQERFFGYVRVTQLERGFFFINYFVDKDTYSIFAHVRQLHPGSPLPQEGRKLFFSIGTNPRNGRPMATDIQVFPEE